MPVVPPIPGVGDDHKIEGADILYFFDVSDLFQLGVMCVGEDPELLLIEGVMWVLEYKSRSVVGTVIMASLSPFFTCSWQRGQGNVSHSARICMRLSASVTMS